MKKTYLRGELYYADLGTGIGSEQNGYRPVVIIQNDVGNRHSPTNRSDSFETRAAQGSLLRTTGRRVLIFVQFLRHPIGTTYTPSWRRYA